MRYTIIRLLFSLLLVAASAQRRACAQARVSERWTRAVRKALPEIGGTGPAVWAAANLGRLSRGAPEYFQEVLEPVVARMEGQGLSAQNLAAQALGSALIAQTDESSRRAKEILDAHDKGEAAGERLLEDTRDAERLLTRQIPYLEKGLAPRLWRANTELQEKVRQLRGELMLGSSEAAADVLSKGPPPEDLVVPEAAGKASGRRPGKPDLIMEVTTLIGEIKEQMDIYTLKHPTFGYHDSAHPIDYPVAWGRIFKTLMSVQYESDLSPAKASQLLEALDPVLGRFAEVMGRADPSKEEAQLWTGKAARLWTLLQQRADEEGPRKG